MPRSKSVQSVSPVSVEPRAFRIKEVARYLGLNPWTIEILIRKKELPAIRVSRHYTILKQDADAWLDKQRALVGRA